MPDVYKHTRPRTEGDLIVSEYDPLYTRETVIISGGSGSDRKVPNFSVLGKISVGALAVAAAKTGTGNGVITGATIAAGSKVGVFTAVCIEPAANGGVFEIEDPDGVVLGTAQVGAAFTLGGLTATIADGATDWVSGDIVKYTVSAATGSGEYLPVNATATDGTQNAAAILVSRRDVVAPDGVDVTASAIVRGPTIVRVEELAWPTGATDPQKAAWIDQLKAAGILALTSG